MAGRFEPFLINPPRRLPRYGRRTLTKRRNPMIDTPEEIAAFEKEWGRKAGAHKRTKHVSTLVAGGVRKRKPKRHRKSTKRSKAAKKAWRARRMKGRAIMAKRRGRKRAVARVRHRRTTIRRVRRAMARAHHVKRYRGPKRKRIGRTKRMSIQVYKRGKGLYTVPWSKSVWPNHRVNPFRRFRRNPFGSEAMIIGSNPYRRRRRKYSKRRHRRNPMARRRSRRFSRNPLATFGHLLPMVLSGTIGALVTKNAPRMLGMTSPFAVYGTQAVVVLGGGWAVDKFVGRNASDGWVVGGAVTVLSGLLSGIAGGMLAGLGLDYEAFPENVGGLDAFPMGMLGENQDAYATGMPDDVVTAVY